ncbi:MBOAT family protein [Glarea lozoyensis ATCC 20868]|uniref:MBOAT family protein n=1 Tax=Glarea lozoyensis (strain ATCC 20868 / MF5171) TaxID=1116229 RepID=S3CMZ0_GLAL2|nr:MBOAT family protein [Glarea lozoyensis ATCC 20868]EPE27827.1 MBOAT family protein [Glarea lozoyensis ATCC 20868]
MSVAESPRLVGRWSVEASPDVGTSRSTSESGGEENYESVQHSAAEIVEGGKGGGLEEKLVHGKNELSVGRPGPMRLKSIPITLDRLTEKGKYVLTADKTALREILKLSIEREEKSVSGKQKGKFSDMVFTHRFTTFDGRNPASADSEFHGFFNLFWLGVAIFMLQLFLENYQKYGSVLGGNQIVQMMFQRDVMVLVLSSAGICMTSLFGLILQKLVHKRYLGWNGSGWIIQGVWELVFLVAAIEWTVFREWPWTHSFYFTVQSLVILMKQHSYAFYNGHLSEAFHMRSKLQGVLRQLESVDPIATQSNTMPQVSSLSTSYLDHRPTSSDLSQRRQSLRGDAMDGSTIKQVATAVESGDPLDIDQVHAFERIIKWEIDALTVDLNGRCTKTANHYPKNLTVSNLLDFTTLPTLVYELEYPRSDKIDWYYAAEKAIATFGIISVMNILSQARIYPVVMKTVAMRETMDLTDRLYEFPLILNALIFPFIMEYLLKTWYVIWECVLNFLAEITRFADRGFCKDWWNAPSFDAYARDWNRPVHLFLLRHVYNSSISAMKVNKYTATLITFLLSAVLHELLMFILFKRVRGYLFMLQLSQIPLIAFARTKFMKKRPVAGNLLLWFGLVM